MNLKEIWLKIKLLYCENRQTIDRAMSIFLVLIVIWNTSEISLLCSEQDRVKSENIQTAKKIEDLSSQKKIIDEAISQIKSIGEINSELVKQLKSIVEYNRLATSEIEKLSIGQRNLASQIEDMNGFGQTVLNDNKRIANIEETLSSIDIIPATFDNSSPKPLVKKHVSTSDNLKFLKPWKWFGSSN